MNKIFFVDNYLFDGIVTHKRLHPIIHSFKYYATYFWFDIKNFKESNIFDKKSWQGRNRNWSRPATRGPSS